MAFNHTAYNASFLANPGQNDAVSYGITVTPANVQQGVTYWRCIGIHHLTGDENRGNHHVYADVLDEAGRRIQGAELKIINNGKASGVAKIDKPDNEAGTNIPMWANDLLGVHVTEPPESDMPNGFHTRHADEGTGNTWGHHSFYVVWQVAISGHPVPPDPIPPQPGKTPKVWTIPLLSKKGEIEVGIKIEVWPW